MVIIVPTRIAPVARIRNRIGFFSHMLDVQLVAAGLERQIGLERGDVPLADVGIRLLAVLLPALVYRVDQYYDLAGLGIEVGIVLADTFFPPRKAIGIGLAVGEGSLKQLLAVIDVGLVGWKLLDGLPVLAPDRVDGIYAVGKVVKSDVRKLLLEILLEGLEILRRAS